MPLAPWETEAKETLAPWENPAPAPDPQAATRAELEAERAKPEPGLGRGLQEYFGEIGTAIAEAARRGWRQSQAADALNVGDVEALAGHQSAIEAGPPQSEALTAFNQSAGFGAALKALMADPLAVGSELTAESLAAFLPTLASKAPARVMVGLGAGAAAGAPLAGIGAAPGAALGATAGFIEATGATSYQLEYTGKFMEELAQAGVKTSDPASLKEAFANRELMAAAHAKAHAKAAPIALWDAFSALAGGKLITQPAKTALRKVAQGAGEVAVQSVAGGAGELHGQISAGEPLNAAAILGEVIGEPFGSAHEIALGALQTGKAPTLPVDLRAAATRDLPVVESPGNSSRTPDITSGSLPERTPPAAIPLAPPAPAPAAAPPAMGRFVFQQNGNELVITAPTEDIAKELAFRGHPGAEFVRAEPAAQVEPKPTEKAPAAEINYAPWEIGGGTPGTSAPEDSAVDYPYSAARVASEPQTTTELSPDGRKVVAVEMPVAVIEVDPVLVPQLKNDADETSGEVRGEELKGDTYQRPSNPIVVWQLRNGRNIVVTGRHRFALAKRLGEQTIPATIVREADGFTRQNALTLDAEFNIRDGNGSVDDYANYIENTPDLTEQEARARGLLDRAKGEAAWSLARSASNDLKALYKAGKLDQREAVGISSEAPGDARLQSLGIHHALAGKSAAWIRNRIRTERAKGEKVSSTQKDLWGNEVFAEEDAMANRATELERQVVEQIKAVQGAVKRPDVARELGVDVQDPAGVANKIVELKNELARWQNWPLHPDLVAKAKGLPPGAQMSLGQGMVPLRIAPSNLRGDLSPQQKKVFSAPESVSVLNSWRQQAFKELSSAGFMPREVGSLVSWVGQDGKILVQLQKQPHPDATNPRSHGLAMREADAAQIANAVAMVRQRQSKRGTKIVHTHTASSGSRYLAALIDGRPWMVRIATHSERTGDSSILLGNKIRRENLEQLAPGEDANHLTIITNAPRSVTWKQVQDEARQQWVDENESASESAASRTIEGDSLKSASPNQIQAESQMVEGNRIPPQSGLPVNTQFSIAQDLDKKINRLTEKRDSGTRLSVDEEAQLRRLETARGQQDLLTQPVDSKEDRDRRAAELRGQAAELFRRADVQQQRGFNSVHRQEELLKGAQAYRAEATRLVTLADKLDGGVRAELLLPDARPETPSPQLTLFSVNSPAAPDSATADVRAIAEQEAGDAPLAPPVHDATLTHNGQIVEGWFDPVTGRIVLNAAAPTMGNPKRVREVTRHERIHWLFTTAEGHAELQKFYQRNVMTPAQRAALIARGYRRGSMTRAEFDLYLANEFIAQQAENNTVWWKRFIAHLLAWAKGQKGFADIKAEEIAQAVIRRLNAAQAERQLAHGYLQASNGVLTAPWARVKDILASLTAYHGTPHRVDKFATAMIGTGEGAQVYGWGLYFAENQDVADVYQRTLSAKNKVEIRRNGKKVDSFANGPAQALEQSAELIRRGAVDARGFPLDKTGVAQLARKLFPQQSDGINKMLAEDFEVHLSGGNKYTVTLNVEPEDLLDWYKPLSEQSEKVRKALRDLEGSAGALREEIAQRRQVAQGSDRRAALNQKIIADLERRLVQEESRTGQALYNMIPRGNTGEAKVATDYLHTRGIRGIRYLDQGSRGGLIGEPFHDAQTDKWYVPGLSKQTSRPARSFNTKAEAQAAYNSAVTYNYVIFDENDITITHENGQPVSAGQLMPQFSLAPVTPVSPETQTQIAVIEQQAGNVNERPTASTLATNPALRNKFRDAWDTVSGKIHYYGGAELLRDERGIDLKASYQAAAVTKQSDALLNQLFSSAYTATAGFKLPQWMKVGAWANRTRAFKKRLLHVAARLNATGRNPDGSFKFDDFKVRSGMMTLKAFKDGKHTVGNTFMHVDPDIGVTEQFEIGPLVTTPEGRVGYQLLRSMDGNTQAELYRTMNESFPELIWLLDMFIDPALANVRQTINGIEIPVFNRFAQAAMMAEGNPNFTPLTGYTPDVLVSRSLMGAIRGALSFSQGTRSPGRKYKFGTSRESGHVRDLLTGFNVRTFQMLQEKARKEWRGAILTAAADVPQGGVPTGWVRLELGMNDLKDAMLRLKNWTSPIDPATGKPVFPEVEARFGLKAQQIDPFAFSKLVQEIHQLSGPNKMLPQPLIETLIKKSVSMKEHGALYKLAAWGVRNSTQLFLVMPKTYVANVLTNDLFAAEAGTRYALRGLMSGNTNDLRFARNLFAGTFTNRFAGLRTMLGVRTESDYMKAIREILPDQIFADGTSLADVKVRWGTSAWDYLRQGEIGGAALQMIQYGSIDVRGKQRMAFAFLKANAVSNAKRASLKGKALKAAVDKYLANPPLDDRVQAVEIANFELLNYAETPDALNNLSKSDFSRLVMPFPRFGYHYVTKQLKRASAAKVLLGKVPKGQRADAFADLVTFGIYGAGGGGVLALALARALGGDDDDDDARKLVGASTVPVVQPDGSVTIKPIDREYITANRMNISAWARAMGIESDNEDDFWLRVRNYPVVAAAGVTALAYADAKKHGAAVGARQFVAGARDLASDFFSVGAAIKVPEKILWDTANGQNNRTLTDPFAQGVPLSFYITEQLTDSFIPGSRQADELIAWINPTRPRRTESKSLDYHPGVVEAIQASHLTGVIDRLARGGEMGLVPAGQINRRTASVPVPSVITPAERISSLGGFNVKAINRAEYERAVNR